MKWNGGEDGSSDNSSIPQLALEDYMERPLRLAGRPPMTGLQKLFTGLFYAQLAFQLICGVVLWGSRTVTPKINGNCPFGYTGLPDHTMVCISDALYAKQQACTQEQQNDATSSDTFSSGDTFSTARRLQATEKTNKVWDMLGRHSRLPATTIAVSAVMCVLVLFSLTFAAACVTWGLFIFNGLLMIYGFYLTQNWMLLVALVVIAALTIWRKEDIDAAIISMKVGSEALQATPIVFLLCAAIQLVWLVYALVFMWCTTFNVPGAYDLDLNCDPVKPSFWLQLYLSSCPFLFVLTTFFFRYCILAVCSLAVGAWCFPEEAAEQGFSSSGAATLGLELAFSKSCGSIFGASMIMSVVDALRKKVMSDGLLSWLDPMACLARMAWCALESTIGTLTRFALIGHMFQGDGLCYVGNLTGPMLQRRLPGVLSCGIVSEKVTRQLAMMGATGVGFVVWWWLDSQEQLGFFGQVKSLVGSANSDANTNEMISNTSWIIVCLTLVMLWCVRNPIITIISCLFISLFESDNGWVSAFMIAVVLASFVAVVFNFFCLALEYATDTAYYCMVLQAEGSSRRNIRLQPLHDIAQKRAEKEAADNNL